MTVIPTHDHTIPQVALRGGIAIVLLALATATFARLTDIGTVRVAPVVAATESRDLIFDIRRDGSVAVLDANATTASPLHVVPATGNEGFVRVALQTFVRDRTAAGIKENVPFRLMRQHSSDAYATRLWLEDLATHRRLTLDAFGSGNAKVFAKFLDVKTSDAGMPTQRATDQKKAMP
jgi:putative photosynthetic complex assembly protein